jgi:AraC-like DNA-binding protein
MLNAFPQIKTRRIEELEHTVSRAYGRISFDANGGRSGFSAVANHAQLKRISLTYATHGCGVEIGIPEADFFGQLFSVKGVGEARARGTNAVVSGQQSFVCSPADRVGLSYAPGFEQLVLKVNAQALVNHLELITGEPATGPIRFETQSSLSQPGGAFHYKLVQRLVGLLDDADGTVPDAALELEQALMTSFLLANRHSMSSRLQDAPQAASPWQVRRAEEYIETHWCEAVTIEDIAKACETSIRSLFHTFKRHRGYSPMEFLRITRLKQARAMLTSNPETASVTDVAMSCGFSNLGHFAKYYRQQFSELPSDTVNRSKAQTSAN